MRTYLMLGTAAFTLAACGGGAGPETAGSVAPPVVNGDTHSFVKPTVAKTYDAVGTVQHYEYTTRSDDSGQDGQLYAGDANTVRNAGISVAYDPRDAIFEVTINRPAANVNINARFQDPAHRTDFGGAVQPQAGVPQLDATKAIQYLQSGSSGGNAARATGGYLVGQPGFQSTGKTFFYQKPGTTTRYVTYGGFVQNTLSTEAVSEPVYDATGRPVTNPDGTAATYTYLRNHYALDRSVFAWGERSDSNVVPKTGTGTFTGDMLATLVYNDRLDVNASSPTYYQWIAGTNQTVVDFGASTVTTTLSGTVSAPTVDAYTNGIASIATGSTFSATGAATIDLVNKGGFTGAFSDARFRATGASSDTVLTIAGSSLDGAFFGPAAEEIGAGFRIVGGTPDERIDIHGVFTGRK